MPASPGPAVTTILCRSVRGCQDQAFVRGDIAADAGSAGVGRNANGSKREPIEIIKAAKRPDFGGDCLDSARLGTPRSI
jgi:hypothetical protein